ncbi:hypothetical protein BKA62DRAFT_756525 [Auriculariales sp. MPI-PUGE-AT-0066]|nr:hypothetical protein BKA62DRAFT_756525 [Auriculariales sp. MPI-PUGE-AT-0066]
MPALSVPPQILKEEDVRFFQGRFTGWISGAGLMSFEWETVRDMPALPVPPQILKEEGDKFSQGVSRVGYLALLKWTPMAGGGSICSPAGYSGTYSDHHGDGYQLLKLLLNRTRLSLSVLHLMPLSFGTPPAGIDGLIPEMTGLRTLALGDIPFATAYGSSEEDASTPNPHYSVKAATRDRFQQRLRRRGILGRGGRKQRIAHQQGLD